MHFVPCYNLTKTRYANRFSLGSFMDPLILLVVVLFGLFLASSSSLMARPIDPSLISDCDSFRGTFRSHGRHDSNFTVGAVLPGLLPDFDNRNYRFLGSDLLSCSPECNRGKTTLDGEIAFAFQFRDGILFWASINPPDGKVLARGEEPWDCKDGVLFTKQSEWAAPNNSWATGYFSTGRLLLINKAGWLIQYRRNSSAGFVLRPIPLPTLGTHTEKLMEFPPDSHLQIDYPALFPGPFSTHSALSKVSTSYPPEDPELTMVERAVLTLDSPKTIGDLTLTLKEASNTRRKDDYYNSHATVLARRGGKEQTIDLIKDHKVDQFSYLPVFNREIALDTAHTRRKPHFVVIQLLPTDDPLLPEPSPSPPSPPIIITLALKQTIQVGDLSVRLNSALYDHDDDSASSTATLSITRGDQTRIVQLSNDHSTPGMKFQSIFGREVGLAVSLVYQKPVQATIWIRQP